MTRVWTLVGLTAIALSARAAVAAPAPTDAAGGGGEVKSLSVVPAAGRAEVVIAVNGAVDVQDFSLTSPPRIVLDFKGARLSASPKLYDKIPRGSVTNVRIAQYRDNVVRVVVDLNAEHPYTINRQNGSVRLAIDGDAGGAFAAWHATTEPAEYAAADPDPAPEAKTPAPVRQASNEPHLRSSTRPFLAAAAQPRP